MTKVAFLLKPMTISLAFGLAIPASPALAEDAARDLVGQLVDCTDATGPLRLLVAGLPNAQTTLTVDAAARLRLDVETMLLGTGAVKISAGRDAERLRGIVDGLDPVAVEAVLATATAGDAVVFIVDPVRKDDMLAFRLQAITPDATCKVTSDTLQIAIAAAGAASIDRVIDAALDDLLRIAPEVDRLNICPVVSEAGYSGCSAALTDSLAAAAVARALDPNRILAERKLNVERLGVAACATAKGDTGAQTSPDADQDTLQSMARLSQDAAGAVWLDLAFLRDAQVVSAGPRRQVDLAGLGCDAAVRPLLDFVSLTANRDASRLDLTAPAFEQGQRLEVRVDLADPGPLYCWVVAPDETAFVVLPVGETSEVQSGSYSYPADFGLGDIVLSGTFENLFHCFAPSDPLPAALDQSWRAAGPQPDGQVLLDSAAIVTMLEDMRAQPGMVEATTRILVR
jgi:hypothetical protein